MPTQQYAASVQGVSIRVTRLDGAGNLLTGPTDSYTLSSFIRVSFTPEYEEGDEITEKAADGTVCVSFKAPDTLKRVTMEIAICNPDPEITALMSGGLLLTRGSGDAAQSVGWASGQVGEDPSRDGVAVEVWSYAVINGRKASTYPYYMWVFPYVKVRQSGDRVIENGLLANTFEGFGLGNINYRSGPDGRWSWPAAADRPYMYARADWAPVGYNGFYTWDAAASPAEEGTATTVLSDTPGINVPGTEDYDPSEDIDLILNASDGGGAAPIAASGATSGTPGTWTGGAAPASVSALQSASPAIVANPSTAWTTGQYVQTATSGNTGQAYWNGTAWTAGKAT
jgi:hypothetical protein